MIPLAISLDLPEWEGFLKYGYIGLSLAFALLVCFLLKLVIDKMQQPGFAPVYVFMVFIFVVAVGGAVIQYATNTNITITKAPPPFVIIKSGMGGSDYNQSGFELNRPGGRPLTQHVDLKGAGFTKSPNVILGLTHIDATANRNTRINIHAENISPDGFDVIASVWSDSSLAGVQWNWVAFQSQ